MAQIPGSGFVVQTVRGLGGPMPLPGLTAAVVMLLLATSWVQAQSATTSNSTQKNNAPISTASPVTPQAVAPQPVFLPPLSVEEKPPQPPVVAWDGKQLTIDAENSTLASVLSAVRERTGASIEIPGTAARERVFVHLGPGPARDVISSMLYGTSFDYIVEAADDDPDTLRSVVLTARGLGDGSNDVVAGATVTGGGEGSTLAVDANRGIATNGRTRTEGMRMMKGWASPGKPTSTAEAEVILAAQEAAKEQESAAAQESAATRDSAAAQGSAAIQDSAMTQGSESFSPVQSSAATADAAEGATALNSPSTSDSDDPSGVGHAIQNMTRMFEQRRQIQAQQNQSPPSSSN